MTGDYEDRLRAVTGDYEARLRTVTIGEPERLTGPIELCSYDPGWPDAYSQLAAGVRRALGSRVVRLEHVGSTAVPGLAAKPIIDVVLEVSQSANEAAYVPDLERIGCVLRIREPEWFEHRLLRGRVGGLSVNLHVFSDGCAETERMVRFRDRLRNDAGALRRYEQAKRELASRGWTYLQQYADAKAAVIEEILAF